MVKWLGTSTCGGEWQHVTGIWGGGTGLPRGTDLPGLGTMAPYPFLGTGGGGSQRPRRRLEYGEAVAVLRSLALFNGNVYAGQLSLLTEWSMRQSARA
jgi:hypothetical protein